MSDYKNISFKAWTDAEPSIRYPAQPERLVVDGDIRRRDEEIAELTRKLEAAEARAVDPAYLAALEAEHDAAMSYYEYAYPDNGVNWLEKVAAVEAVKGK